LRVSFEKECVKYIKPKDKKEIVKQLSEVFLIDNSSDSIEKGWQRWLSFIDRNKNKYPVLERMRGERYRYYFTYLKYDYRIRPMIYTTNWIERLNRDYKRTLRMRGALPNPEAAILLMGYVAMNHKAYERKVPKLDYDRSFQWEE
jgi:transposase-like protein